MHRLLIAVPALLAALAVHGGLAAQQARSDSVADPGPKAQFVGALVQFTAAIAGTYGDEGSRVWSSIDSMQRALDAWDDAVRAYETAVRAQLTGADRHVALAATYLDRRRVEDALREFEAAIGLQPKRPELHVFHGLAYGLANRTEEAAEAFRTATTLDANEPTTFYLLAQYSRRLGRSDAAADALQRFHAAQLRRLATSGRPQAPTARFTTLALLQDGSSTPVFPLARYARGFTRLEQGHYEQAVDEFRQAAARDPLNVPAVNGRDEADALAQGSAALRRGALRPALDYLRAAVEAAPTRGEAQRLLGMAYWADEAYDRSIEHLTVAVGLDTLDERARLALAEVLVSAGKPDEAERTLRDTIDVLPDSGQARYRLGRLYHTLERYPEALHEFEEAVVRQPVAGLGTLYQIIGLTHVLEQDGDSAIEAYRRQVEVSLNNPDAHRALGDALVGRDRYDEALAEFLAALLVDDQDARAHAALARIHLERRQYPDAVEAAQRALLLDGTHKEAQYALATALIRLGRTEDGTAELRRFQDMQAAAQALERRAYELDALRRQAALSLESGDYDTAIALLGRAVAYQPDQAEAHISLGRALLEGGRSEEALTSFDRALALDVGVDVHGAMSEAYRAMGRLDDSRRHDALDEAQKEERLRRGAFP
jgi:tetratricopeptide (TPR) repeat protein